MACAFLFQIGFFITVMLGLSTSEVKIENRVKEFGPVLGWPKFDKFGQVSAVDVDIWGNVYVFHRGNRLWNYSSFSKDNIFADKNQGPIPNETIIVLERNQGSLLKKTGALLFYLPHGLTVDGENNVWVTDVALHQVFKFPPINLTQQEGDLGEPLLTLGVPFQPGNDMKHFCKPTGVAVDMETKEFYISDGYCNSRIIKYDPLGNMLLVFGRSSLGSPQVNGYMLNVPHALAFTPEKQTLFVADRENSRVVSYDSRSGKFKRSFAEELKGRLFSVAYFPAEGGLLFVLRNDNVGPKVVAVYSAETGKLILSFSPKDNFTNPHDLAISPDGQYCYVVELKPYKVWTFKLGLSTISQLNHPTASNVKETIKDLADKALPAESKTNKAEDSETGGSFLAVGIIVLMILISFLAFLLHYRGRKASYREYESGRLISDDSDGGIRLT